jgi:hypothetical protein
MHILKHDVQQGFSNIVGLSEAVESRWNRQGFYYNDETTKAEKRG